MDRHHWMYEIPRTTIEYWRGVEEFIKSAERFKKNEGEDSIVCPCRDCKNTSNLPVRCNGDKL